MPSKIIIKHTIFVVKHFQNCTGISYQGDLYLSPCWCSSQQNRLFISLLSLKKRKNELKEKDVSVSFDGTTRLGEALAIAVRYVDNIFCIHQREELAREIINILSITYSIRPNNVIGMMRDGASVNGAAIRFIKVVYPYLVDISCYSHALNRVGDHFEAPHLAEFTTM